MCTREIERDIQLEKNNFAEELLGSIIASTASVMNETTTSSVHSVFEGKLNNKTLQLITTKPERKEKPKKRKRKLTAKEIKEKKLFKIDKDETFNYASYLPLYKLWKSYIQDVLSTTPPSAYTTKLIKSDFHGAKMVVSKSKNPSLVGISGIVIKESKNCFFFVTKENKLKQIPKDNSNFVMIIKDQIITIYGKHILFRPHERSKVKLKFKPTIAF